MKLKAAGVVEPSEKEVIYFPYTWICQDITPKVVAALEELQEENLGAGLL